MRHSDYSSYLTNLKQTKLGKYLSNNNYNEITDQISKLSVDVEFLRKTQQIYITKTPTFENISIQSFNTFILQPIDLDINTDYFSIFNLPANNDQINNGVNV